MTRVKKKTLAVFIAAIVALQAVIVIPVSAASFRITTNRDDIYKKLEEAAKLNVLTRALKKCLDSDEYMPYRMDYVDEAGNHFSSNYLEGGDISQGKIFNDPWGHLLDTDFTTARWLESQMGAGDDGKYWCHEGQGDGTGLFDLYADALRVDKADLLCNGNEARIMSRAMYYYDDAHMSVSGGYYPINERCSSFSDDMALYILSPNYASALEGIYNDYKASSGNQFLPDFSTIGQYNNIDGYFNYYIDFKLACGAEMYREPRSDVEIYPVTTFDKEDLKIVAKTNYVHITEDDSWSGALSADNPVTTCAGLLTRIEELHNTWNGIAATRNAGYEGIIAYILQETCNNMTDSEGNNVWTKLRTELQKIVNDPDAPEKAKADAQASLTKINNAGGNYMTITGDYTDPEGKIYECLDVDELEVHLSDYTYGMEDWEEEEMAEADCYTNAGSLGWIVCPLITTGADMIQGTYEGMVVPFLRLDPQLFKADNGTYMAWDVFRNISNIAFVAVFLVVILSQLTGYGIDNYGIKKILPKLIVAAILINMSYIICQLAIDIANIFGSAIGDLFTSIGNKIMINSPPVCSSGGADACVAVTAGKSGGAGAWIALIAVVLAITVGAVLAIGPQILIPVLLAIISFVIAIFFLFIILGVRQALSVLLVAISPCAFLCYMLPNTKMIFNKWLTTIKGILLAYPICSAMIYGGDMVAKIIIAAYGGTPKDLASITPMLSAGVVAVAPIFLIPSTIKKSMGGLGALAGRLQSGMNHWGRGKANQRLQMSPLTQRQRYRDKMRMDRSNARMGEYNRRRAERALNGSEKLKSTKFAKTPVGQFIHFGQGLADRDYTKMNATQRRAYNVANNTVAASDQEMMAGYRNYTASINADQAQGLLMGAVDKKGNIDMNMADAAIDRMGQLDQGQMLEALQEFTQKADLSKMTSAQRNRFVQMLQKQDGNTVAKAYAKEIAGGSNASLSKAISDGDIAKRIRDMDKNIVANTDKDVLRYMSGQDHKHDTNADSAALANAFTNEQMATAMSSSAISGKSETEFRSLIEHRDASMVKADIDRITTDQFTTTMDTSLEAAKKAMSEGGMDGEAEVHRMASEHMTKLMQPGNEQLLQRVSKDKFKYAPPSSGGSAGGASGGSAGGSGSGSTA